MMLIIQYVGALHKQDIAALFRLIEKKMLRAFFSSLRYTEPSVRFAHSYGSRPTSPRPRKKPSRWTTLFLAGARERLPNFDTFNTLR